MDTSYFRRSACPRIFTKSCHIFQTRDCTTKIALCFSARFLRWQCGREFVFTELIWNCKAESPARQANYEFLNLNFMQVHRLFICWNPFICGLFKGAVSVSGCVALNLLALNSYCIVKDVEGDGHGLNWGTIPKSREGTPESHYKPIIDSHLQHTTRKPCRCSHLAG
jgi:hypothetical protein